MYTLLVCCGFLALWAVSLCGRLMAWMRDQADVREARQRADAETCLNLGVFATFGSPQYLESRRKSDSISASDQLKLRGMALYTARFEADERGTSIEVFSPVELEALIENAVCEYKARWVEEQAVSDEFRKRLLGRGDS